MKSLGIVISVCCLSFLMTACASQYKEMERTVKQPVNCATAEADLRVLKNEKTHVAEQIAAGVSAIMPIGLVAGMVTGTENTKLEISTGEYNQMIDDKIAEIRYECGVY